MTGGTSGKGDRIYEPPRLFDMGGIEERADGATGCGGGNTDSIGGCGGGRNNAGGGCGGGNNNQTGSCGGGNNVRRPRRARGR